MQIMDLASVTIIIASLSVVLGVILTILQLRTQVKDRQAQLVVQLYSQFSSTEFLENMNYTFDQFKNIDPDAVPESWESKVPNWRDTRMNSVIAFFEGIGILVKRNLIDINLVADMLSTPIIMVWETIEPRVMARRKALQRDQIWDWFQYLYYEIQKIPSKSWQA
ncbi:MAG: DUF4760 domain-containing protein [Candidatus Thorarchaeota archaeon]